MWLQFVLETLPVIVMKRISDGMRRFREDCRWVRSGMGM